MTPEHAVEVTARLREDEPPLGLDESEAICPKCCLAYFVTNRAFDWGLCRDCLDVALEPVRDLPGPPAPPF